MPMSPFVQLSEEQTISQQHTPKPTSSSSSSGVSSGEPHYPQLRTPVTDMLRLKYNLNNHSTDIDGGSSFYGRDVVTFECDTFNGTPPTPHRHFNCELKPIGVHLSDICQFPNTNTSVQSTRIESDSDELL
jgi:hypothetical protein